MSDIQEIPPVLLSGIDSLYVGFHIDGLGMDWEDLAFRKAQAQHEQKDFVTVTLGGRRWALLPRGRHPYTYVLKSTYATVSLAERMQPRCFVQFHSEALWTQGAEGLIRDIRDWFAAIGTTETRPEGISRSDWAFDIALSHADFRPDHVITRAVKDATWRSSGSIQTIQFGKGDVVLRIYDKVAEIEEKSGKTWLYDLWDCKEGVWRVEYQVRRERLRAAGISTIETLRDFEGDLLTELTGKHASMRKPTGDSNRSRWPLHPMWQAVKNAVAEMDRHGLVRSYDPDSSLAYAEDRSLKSIEGMLKNVGSIRTLRQHRQEPVSLPELMKWLSEKLEKQMPPELWVEEVRTRAEKRRMGL